MAPDCYGDDGSYVVDSSQSLVEETTSALPLPTLPFDLVAEILCRLPVKLLIQLRCLCKSINSLISDPKFAKKHLRMSNTRHHLMLSSNNDLDELVLFDSPMPSDFPTFTVNQTQLSYPDCLKIEYDSPLHARSCDGILCFTMYNGPGVGPPVLWNPSIRTFKILPPLDNKPFSAYSFGYDHCIDKYKIVAISLVEDREEVSVHTLGTDTWRRIPDFPYSGPFCGYGIFVGGTVNWLSLDEVSSLCVIVSLDLEKESYQTLSLPDIENDPLTNLGDLGVLRDCLCIFASSDMFFDVWIMKEYGNKKSWTRLYRVPYMEDRGLCRYTKALYISEDEQLLMDFKELESQKLKLFVYDSNDGTLEIPEIQNIGGWMDPEVYIESLISPCS
ncbi:F-box/kelch-repeat protein At3g23880 [Medicago truncatula]|uniref:F-box/kelch-repeat protein At3g23880 n=1 Tax=Medicago truncatula TaxID=3880 RepID=UPI0019673C3E|nr:F-box/kelch-repeat protein At3g23880 [Medicago truncatula]